MCDSGRAVEQKIPCFRERRPDMDDGRVFCVWRLDRAMEVKELFEGAEPGEKVELEFCEMTEAEIEALPDFEGW